MGGCTQSLGDRPNPPFSANPGSSGVGLSLCSSRTPALFWDDTSLPPLCPFLSSWHVASQRRECILSGPTAQREEGSSEGKLPSFSVIHFLYEQFCFQAALPGHTEFPPEDFWTLRGRAKGVLFLIRWCPFESQVSY